MTHQSTEPAAFVLPEIELKRNSPTPGDIDRFIQEAVLVGARVTRCGQSEIRNSILQVLETHPGEAAIQFENRELLRYCGWDSGAQKSSGVCHSELRAKEELVSRDFEISSVAVGVTGVDYGLADTGTLVLLTSGERGRLLSLLPPVHIAIVPQQRILPDLANFLATGPPSSSAIIFITGPSKTADIDQRLTTGVHGPGQIYILVVED